MYVRVDVPSDGSCMFHAVALATSTTGTTLRHTVCDFIRTKHAHSLSGLPLSQWIRESEGMSTADYAAQLSKPSTWGGAIELACLSIVLQRCIAVYVMGEAGSAKRIACFGDTLGRPIFILYTGSHYMGLRHGRYNTV